MFEGVENAIYVGNQWQPDTGTTGTRTISGNTIETTGTGIIVNNNFSIPSEMTITGNAISDGAVAGQNGTGIVIWALQGGATVVVEDNDVTGMATGVEVWNTTVTVTGGTLDGNAVGVRATNTTDFGDQPASVTIAGTTISNSTTAAVMADDTGTGTNVAEVIFDATNPPTLTGNADPDVLVTGDDGAFDAGGYTTDGLRIDGDGAANTIVGSAGDDDIDGKGGTDTVIYDDARADYTVGVSADGNGFVTAFTSVAESGGDMDEGTDTLTGIEVLQFGDVSLDLADPVQLFNGSGDLIGTFDTIQGAVDAASNGATILVSAGTYQEQVVINGLDDLTLKGVGGTVTILAPADLVQTSTSSGATGIGSLNSRETHALITVEGATNVTLENLTVDGDGKAATIDEGADAGQAQFVGVFFRNASGNVTDVDILDVRDEPLSGAQRGVGLQVDNDTVMEFTMTGGSVTGAQKNSLVFFKADLDVSGVTVTGIGATNLIAQNGMLVVESTGDIDGNTISGFGYIGGAYSTHIYSAGNTDLNITNNIITGTTGANTASNDYGILVADFGADTSGGSIAGNTISFVDIGIDVTGVGVQPTSILIENNTVSNLDTTTDGQGVWFTPAVNSTAHDVDGTATADVIYGGDGVDTLAGLGGNDEIAGRGGADIINAGEGDDSVVIIAASEFASGETIEGGSGTDTLYFVGAGAGDSLSLSADVIGVEAVTILDPVTFTGAGTTALDLDASAVGNGLTITGNDGANTITGTAFGDTINSGGGDDTIVWTIGAGSDTVDGGGNGTAAGDLITVDLDTVAETITIGATSIAVGGETVTYSNVERIDVETLAGNDMINVDHLTGAVLTVAGGASDAVTFTQLDSGTSPVTGGDTLSFAGSTSGIGVMATVGSTFTQTGSGILHSMTGIESVTGTGYADNITGDGGVNVLRGGGDVDTLSGLGGSDVLVGGAGNDTLVGGADNDHLFGGAGQDTHDVSSGQDTSYFYANDGFSAGAPTSHFDTLNAFSADGASMDRLAIQGGSGVFSNLVPGPVNIEYVAIGSYSTVSNVATFILDGVTNSLWFDNAGDGSADFKVVEFGVASNLAGFDADNILVLDADDVIL